MHASTAIGHRQPNECGSESRAITVYQLPGLALVDSYTSNDEIATPRYRTSWQVEAAPPQNSRQDDLMPVLPARCSIRGVQSVIKQLPVYRYWQIPDLAISPMSRS